VCGIVGYVGSRPVLPVILDGLKKLEYRGYDSAGIVLFGQDLSIVKKQGKIARLEQELAGMQLEGQMGIGHTRWATHGVPSDENAHPHLDCSGRLALVHNGIIENYLELKTDLLESGHRFRSETDTEVIAHLVEEKLKTRPALLEAVLAAAADMQGSFALAIASQQFPGRIVAVRRESPLVLGLGKDENFLASDIPALLPYTKDIIILSNNQVAELTRDTVRVFSIDGQELQPQPVRIDWDARLAEKGGFEHFMLKEIHEQPQVIKDTLAGHIDLANEQVLLPELPDELLAGIRRISITACGTAFHAGICGKTWIEEWAGVPVEVEIASEFRYRRRPFLPDTLAVVISQSGETADTLAALRRFKEEGMPVFAITNTFGSSVARESDWVLTTKAGPEIAVASTKAYSSQILSLLLLALRLAQIKGSQPPARLREITRELQRLPLLGDQVLQLESRVQEYANRLRAVDDYFILGRGLDYATSLEGALKLKEISYVHCEAYAAGELKHGPLALITAGKHVCLLATQSELLAKVASNLKEVKARGAEVLVLAGTNGSAGLEGDEIWHLPQTLDLFSPLLAILPLQLFAYYMAKEKGCDIDQPRNLAKSVTVE
jgi:glucosamine--fructose-6-phosphate aminotransferase (isomerizing)